MSKDNIGWIDSDRIKSSVAALRALRKKPQAPAQTTDDALSVDSLFADEAPTPSKGAPPQDLRPITDVAASFESVSEAPDDAFVPAYVPTESPAPAPQAPRAAPEPIAPAAIADAFRESFRPADTIDDADEHVDRSLLEALSVLKDADPEPFDPVDSDEYFDASNVFRGAELASTAKDSTRSASSTRTAAIEPVAPVAPTTSNLDPTRLPTSQGEPLDPAHVFDDIEALSAPRQPQQELDEFGIPIHKSPFKDFATGAFDAVDRQGLEAGGPASSTFLERVDARMRIQDGAPQHRRSALEAVTAENPTVDVDEDERPARVVALDPSFEESDSLHLSTPEDDEAFQSLPPIDASFQPTSVETRRPYESTLEVPTLGGGPDIRTTAPVRTLDEDLSEPEVATFRAEEHESNFRTTAPIHTLQDVPDIRVTSPVATLSPDFNVEDDVVAPSSGEEAEEAQAPQPAVQTPQPAAQAPAFGDVPAPDRFSTTLAWLRALAEWTQSSDPTSRFFVADEDGLGLLSRGIDDDTLALAVATRDAIVRARQVREERLRGSLSYSLADGAFCHLLWHRSEHGLITAGIVTQDALPVATVSALQSEFHAAFSGRAFT